MGAGGRSLPVKINFSFGILRVGFPSMWVQDDSQKIEARI